MNILSVLGKIDLLLYSVIINVIMYFYLRTNGRTENYSTKLFKRIMISTIVISLIEAVSWSTGEFANMAQIPIHYWSNAIFLSLIGLTSAFGLSYLDYKIFGNASMSQRRLIIYLVPTYINISFAVFNHFNKGFLFYIDANNQYHRGIAANISSVLLYFFAILVVGYFYKYRSLITGRITQAISVFVFIPVVGSILQMLSYGTTFGMPSFTLASFLTFLLVEKDEMAKDPLTQLYTRANLESRLRFKLRGSEPFTVMMIDLNDFKRINDTFGHLEGDRVLKVVADILTHSVNVEDTVCRYGGDEFFVLIESNIEIAEELVGRIDKKLEKHNKTNLQGYNINLSYGHEYVNGSNNVTLEDLIFRIDKMMYQDKDAKKQSFITQ